jgi:Na+/proline symporter
MVATTFAADTPLLVAGIVANNGISGNWLWWNMLFGGMLTTFFFARYWRRSGVLTEPELIELRYGGKPAAFLRGFKAVYLGLFMNVIIIGWVNLAMMKILQGIFNITAQESLIFIAIAMFFVASYSAVSGLMGVAISDAIQFTVAMIGCIVLAVIVVQSEAVGGLSGLQAKLPTESLNFFPSFGDGKTSSATILSISVGAFFARIGMQWWSSWYPGAEPGGGGYVAQRMMSCKTENDAVYATLFFQIAHYALRPWPWILVGLSAIVLYPELGASEKEMGFVFAMRDFLPAGLKGLLLAAFFAAYMSTISTQLNWGAGYLVNDLYKRFLDENATEERLVLVSRFGTIVLMIIGFMVTTQLKTIEGAWNFIIECGAGLGLVLILRWYWWRINAWSEIAATIAPFVGYGVSVFVLDLQFPESFFVTVGFTTITWLVVTFTTKPEDEIVLQKFYNQIKPGGFWKPFVNELTVEKQSSSLLFVSWISAVAFVYSFLLLIGKLLFSDWQAAAIYFSIALLSFLTLRFSMKKFS